MNQEILEITLEYLQAQKDIILLDNSLGEEAKNTGKSYLFQNPVKTITAFNEKDFFSALKEMDKLSASYYLAGYINYEAGHFFNDKSHRPKNLKTASVPLLYFGVYEQAHLCRVKNTQTFFTPRITLKNAINKKHYISKINKIKTEIAKGNTYQVNFTFNRKIEACCNPAYLYLYLREKQKTRYSAFIKNKYTNILSFSPELFFKQKKSHIETQPMKGTAARGKTKKQDELNLKNLAASEKNKAENLMIVDLIRNDLSHIAQKNSVKVPKLFKTETHKTLHQMTSLIEAKLAEKTSYSDIFEALFPCGSITGAPKIKTMELISSLEPHTRDVYCGTIGYIAPDNESVFNIPIRTLQKKPNSRLWNYKAGSGIVWDSDPESEYRECLLKTSFITQNGIPKFRLLETMELKNNKIAYEKEHLKRLKESAAFFNFTFEERKIKSLLTDIKQKNKHLMLRLLLGEKGNAECKTIALSSDDKPDKYVKIVTHRLDAKNIFLQHKTTYKPWYKKSLEKIKKKQIWDEIYLNSDGYVCEGSRSNVFIEKNDRLYTPPLSCGLLPGILRADLLKQGKCTEKKITLADLKNADTIYCGNSVRGLVPVILK